MNSKTRTIEVELTTAKTLEARAAERGTSVSELIAELVGADDTWPKGLEAMRRSGHGPWAPSVLAEDAGRYEEYQHTGEGVPLEEVQAWVRSWSTPEELPAPKPRKL